MQTIFNRDYVTQFKDVSTQRSVVAGSDGSVAPLISGTTGFVIVVRRIVVEVTTVAAQSWTFRTSNGTPVVLKAVPASAVAGTYETIYGDGNEGYVIPDGESLNLAMGGTGPAGICVVDAYKRAAANTPLTQAAYAAAW